MFNNGLYNNPDYFIGFKKNNKEIGRCGIVNGFGGVGGIIVKGSGSITVDEGKRIYYCLFSNKMYFIFTEAILVKYNTTLGKHEVMLPNLNYTGFHTVNMNNYNDVIATNADVDLTDKYLRFDMYKLPEWTKFTINTYVRFTINGIAEI